MARKMFGVFTAVAAALLFVGVAWAATDGTAEELSSTETSAPDISDERVTVPTTADDDEDNTTSNTVDLELDDDTTLISIHEDDEDDDSSTSIDDDDDTTLNSIHEDDEDDGDDDSSTSIDDDDEKDGKVFEGQSVVYKIADGSVTVAIVDGQLVLGPIVTTWDYEVETAEADRVEVKFRRGSDELEFEAEIEHGKIKIETELESS